MWGCTAAASLGSVQGGSYRLGFVGVVADNEDPVTEIVGHSQGSLGDLVRRLRPENDPWGNRQSASAFRSEQIRVEDIARWAVSCDGSVLIQAVGTGSPHKGQPEEAHS